MSGTASSPSVSGETVRPIDRPAAWLSSASAPVRWSSAWRGSPGLRWRPTQGESRCPRRHAGRGRGLGCPLPVPCGRGRVHRPCRGKAGQAGPRLPGQRLGSFARGFALPHTHRLDDLAPAVEGGRSPARGVRPEGGDPARECHGRVRGSRAGGKSASCLDGERHAPLSLFWPWTNGHIGSEDPGGFVPHAELQHHSG
jgi:hypothetical protein